MTDDTDARAIELMADAGFLKITDPMPGEPWTQLGYANRLVKVFGDDLRYVRAWQQWLYWDGRRWARDATGHAQRRAKGIARLLTHVAAEYPDAGQRKELKAQARSGETNAFINGALALAAVDEQIALRHADLDADPYLLNVANGTLDLRTWTLRPHDPADNLTKVAGGAYDPEAPGSVFAGFLERVQPDPAMRSFLARLLGHALEGRVAENILPIFCGAGANGKSTLAAAVGAALGDYAAPADSGLLTAKSFDTHPTSIADLCGLRLARLDEGDKGRHLGEGTVKRLTGGDELKARRMREDFWSFKPSHTFLLLTNWKPVITGTDEGIWRRICLVPWDVVIPAAERDLGFAERLLAELDYVLAWLVAGHADWKAGGLREPSAVTDATSEYRGDSDAIGRFLGERCMRMGQIRSAELYGEWQKWCANEGEEAGSNKAFSQALEGRGFDKQHLNTGQHWKGLSLYAE